MRAQRKQDRAAAAGPPWQVELGPGACFDPRLGALPGRPTRLWRRADPMHIYVVDDRHPGQTFAHGEVQLELITISQALDLLAAPSAPAPAPLPPLEDHLHRNDDVAKVLGISTTSLYQLIQRLPPETCGAAVLIGGTGDRRRRRRWVRAELERWLSQAAAPIATSPTPAKITPNRRSVRSQALNHAELPHTAAARVARERLKKS